MANNHTHFYISVTKEIKYTWKIFPWWKEKLALFVPKLNHRCFSYWVSVSYKISLLYFSTLSYLPLILFVGRENEVNFPTNTRRLRLRFQLVLFLFPVDAAWTISFQASTANFSKKKIYICALDVIMTSDFHECRPSMLATLAAHLQTCVQKTRVFLCIS